MSYQVEYNPEFNIRYPIVKAKKKKFGNSIIFFVFCVAVAGLLMIKNGLLHYLIPGDPDVTANAFSSMIAQIESGVSVSESVVAFCEEIIANAS